MGTAEERAVSHSLEFMDWISKTRSQLYIFEKDSVGTKKILREQWQYMGNIHQLEEIFPYIEFFADEDEGSDWWNDEDSEAPKLTLSNGDVISGVNAANEFFSYECHAKLNDIGKDMFEWVKYLSEINLIELNPENKETISIAPWHRRDV